MLGAKQSRLAAPGDTYFWRSQTSDGTSVVASMAYSESGLLFRVAEDINKDSFAVDPIPLLQFAVTQDDKLDNVKGVLSTSFKDDKVGMVSIFFNVIKDQAYTLQGEVHA
jgi:hypothetical protein